MQRVEKERNRSWSSLELFQTRAALLSSACAVVLQGHNFLVNLSICSDQKVAGCYFVSKS